MYKKGRGGHRMEKVWDGVGRLGLMEKVEVGRGHRMEKVKVGGERLEIEKVRWKGEEIGSKMNYY